MRLYTPVLAILIFFSSSLRGQLPRNLKTEVISGTFVSVKVPEGATRFSNANKKISAGYPAVMVDYYVPDILRDKPELYLPEIFILYGMGVGNLPPNSYSKTVYTSNAKFSLYSYEAELKNIAGREERVTIFIRTETSQYTNKVVVLILQYASHQTVDEWDELDSWIALLKNTFIEM
ncbi:MAG: hypothetical protein IPP93_13870 [Chitinophagaceae bacterium]|nr:hypothetical protein [Chitinophagaceae bacterium]MBL0334843.1 hypothetical protein [Chitinophagaceae bacterium]